MSNPDDELQKINEQESLKANFIPKSPIEAMIAETLGIEAVMSFRENFEHQNKANKRQELTSRISNYTTRFFTVYLAVWLIITISRLTYLWLF